MKNLCIEISYTWDSDELPEHEGYYNSIDEARKALDSLEKLFADPEYQLEIDEEIKMANKWRKEDEKNVKKLLLKFVI